MDAVNETTGWRQKAERVLVAAGAPLCVWMAVRYILSGGTEIKCLFYELTGLYCVGCGSGRALSAAFHGDFAEAFSHNCMLFLLGIPCLGVLLHEYVRIVFRGAGLRPVRVPQKAAVVIAGILIAFWVLRNVPAFAFLAP